MTCYKRLATETRAAGGALAADTDSCGGLRARQIRLQQSRRHRVRAPATVPRLSLVTVLKSVGRVARSQQRVPGNDGAGHPCSCARSTEEWRLGQRTFQGGTDCWWIAHGESCPGCAGCGGPLFEARRPIAVIEGERSWWESRKLLLEGSGPKGWPGKRSGGKGLLAARRWAFRTRVVHHKLIESFRVRFVAILAVLHELVSRVRPTALHNSQRAPPLMPGRHALCAVWNV